MKSDIEFPKVEKVGICAIPQEEGEQRLWKVFLINLLDEPLSNVLVSTRGYGKKDKSQVQTSQLRHYFEEVQATGSVGIELIPSDLIGLNNQYWVSFYLGDRIYDKKFIFLPDTLLDQNLVEVPVLREKGILIL